MPEPIEPRESEVLIQKYVAGELTTEEADQLLERLKEQPSLGAALLSQMKIDVLLLELTGATGRIEHWAPPVTGASEREFFPNLLPMPTGRTTVTRFSCASTWKSRLHGQDEFRHPAACERVRFRHDFARHALESLGCISGGCSSSAG